MRKLLAALLALMMLAAMPMAMADELEMSDVPGMTAPGVFPIVTEPVTLTFALVPQGNVEDYDTNYFTTYIEEKTGINVEFFFLPATDTAQKFDLMVAANEKLPDIMMGGISDITYYGMSGQLVALNDYFDKYAYYYNEVMEKYGTEDEKATLKAQSYSYDGNIYAFNYAVPELGNNHENMIYVNKVWLEKLNMKTPTTLDELYEVLVAFRDKDPNGNGLKDEIPIIGYNSFDRRGDVVGDLLQSFLYYPGGVGADQARTIVKDGVVSSAVVQEEYREGLRFVNKLYKEGLLTEISLTQKDTQLKAIIDRPASEPTIAGVICTHFFSGVCGFTNCNDEYNKVLEYEVLAPLAGPEGVAYALEQGSGFSEYKLAITSSCEHPEVAFRVLDALCDPEIGSTYRFGIKGEHWDWAAEGAVTQEGQPAMIKFLVAEQPWHWETQNIIWRLTQGFMSFSDMKQQRADESNPYIKYRNEEFYRGVALRLGAIPAERFLNPIWNEEEYEIATEYGPMIRETSNEWRTMFVTGEKDLDADWDEYLTIMENLGLSEYLEAAQSCYTRMAGN